MPFSCPPAFSFSRGQRCGPPVPPLSCSGTRDLVLLFPLRSFRKISVFQYLTQPSGRDTVICCFSCLGISRPTGIWIGRSTRAGSVVPPAPGSVVPTRAGISRFTGTRVSCSTRAGFGRFTGTPDRSYRPCWDRSFHRYPDLSFRPCRDQSSPPVLGSVVPPVLPELLLELPPELLLELPELELLEPELLEEPSGGFHRCSGSLGVCQSTIGYPQEPSLLRYMIWRSSSVISSVYGLKYWFTISTVSSG